MYFIEDLQIKLTLSTNSCVNSSPLRLLSASSLTIILNCPFSVKFNHNLELRWGYGAFPPHLVLMRLGLELGSGLGARI